MQNIAINKVNGKKCSLIDNLPRYSTYLDNVRLLFERFIKVDAAIKYLHLWNKKELQVQLLIIAKFLGN